ncbi:MAG: MOSC domain-containing protein [Methanobacteriota archaeon]|nr:MAG: MOSC domain-containing protein [Euryarchaeota archaeon]
MDGWLVSINVKPKDATEVGIPKQSIEVAQVTEWGVENDFNYYRFYSKGNTKDRAVLILTKEIIDDLNREGWPVGIGHLGENLTLESVQSSELDVGTELCVGEVQLQITELCQPCRTLANLNYVGQERVDEFITTLKGRRGWYARVLRPGKIRKGDPVRRK